MTDPLRLIPTNALTGLSGAGQAGQAGSAGKAGELPGDSFRDVLLKSLNQVNELQQDASTAIEDLQTGKRNDLETVLMATAKADTAFQMLLSVRNKVMDAYDELKQIRV
jgi:flagellar hook-basal body complex protein FliE